MRTSVLSQREMKMNCKTWKWEFKTLNECYKNLMCTIKTKQMYNLFGNYTVKFSWLQLVLSHRFPVIRNSFISGYFWILFSKMKFQKWKENNAKRKSSANIETFTEVFKNKTNHK